MKKILLTLVVLVFASPALAAVNITLSHVEDTNVVTISWDATGEANLIRAFGLNVQLSNDANIISATGLSEDYWVYPGTIQIAADGTISFMGSIAAEYGDLPSDTLVGPPDGNGVTLEAASLYAPPGDEANEPPQFGDLAEIIVGGKDCVLCVTANVSRAGASGVVMENPDEVVTVVYACIDVNLPEGGPGDCYEGQPDHDQFLVVGSPDCWCNVRQCHGDGDGVLEGDPKGGYFYVGAGDLNILLAAWKVLEPAVAPTPSGPGITSVADGACADFDHVQEGDPKGGYFRVGAGDLGILLANWKILEPAVAPTPSGPGIPDDCMD